MATVAQFNQDDDQQQQNAGGGGQVINSTGAGGSPGVPSNGGGSSPIAPRSTPSGTPNIRQYIQANQGAGQQLAQGIQGNVQNQADSLNQNVNTSKSQLDSQYQPLQQNLGASGQQTIQTAFQDPQKLLNAYNASKTQSSNQPLSSDVQNAANQYQQFQQLNSGGYNQDINAYGKQAQQDTNQLQNQLSGINQQANAANTENGRFQLLQNTVGQPNYTPGQQTLDALFLQAQPGVANQLSQNLGNISSQAGQNINNLNSDAQSKIAALQGLSAQNQQSIHDMFSGGLSDIGNNVNQEYQAAKSNTQAQDLQKALNDKTLTPEYAQILGMQPKTQTWGVDIGNAGHFAVNPLAEQANGGNAQVATPEEFARYNALNTLAGGAAGTLQPSMFGSATTAGDYKPFTFDNNALNQAIANQQNTVENVDFKNALRSVLPNIGYNPPSSSGMGAPNTIDYASGIRGALQSGLDSRSLGPQNANQMITDFIKNRVAQENPEFASHEQQIWNQSFKPFLDYYNNEYLPDSQAGPGIAAQQNRIGK